MDQETERQIKRLDRDIGDLKTEDRLLRERMASISGDQSYDFRAMAVLNGTLLAGNGLTGGGTFPGSVTIAVNPGDGVAISSDQVVVDLVAAWSGLEFSGGDLRVDLDASFTWTDRHIFTTTAGPAIEITMSAGDPRLKFDIGGTDKFVVGVDDSDGDIFKIHGASSLADDSDFHLDNSGNVEIGGDFSFRTGKGVIFADGVTAGMAVVADGTRFIPDQTPTWTDTHTFQGNPGITIDPQADQDHNLLTVNVTGTPTLSWDESEDGATWNKVLRNAAWTERRDGWDLRDTQQELNSAVVRGTLSTGLVSMNEVHGIGGIMALGPCAVVYEEVTT